MRAGTDPGRSVRRLLLATLAVGSGVTGVWAVIAPRSFYDDFIFGRGWVSLGGVFNEHLIRDVGALSLALTLVVLVAFLRMDRFTVRLASGATLLFAIPHLWYHLGAFGPFGPTDVALQLVAFLWQVAIPLWLLWSPEARRLAETEVEAG